MADILTPDRDAAMRAYYDQRAGEYDQWYLRTGRFAERPDSERWHAEVALLRRRVAAFGHGRRYRRGCSTRFDSIPMQCNVGTRYIASLRCIP